MVSSEIFPKTSPSDETDLLQTLNLKNFDLVGSFHVRSGGLLSRDIIVKAIFFSRFNGKEKKKCLEKSLKCPFL